MKFLYLRILASSLFLLTPSLFARFVHESGLPPPREVGEGVYNPPVSILNIPSKCSVAKLNSDGTAFRNPENKCSFYACAAQAADKSNTCDLGDRDSYFLNYGEKYCERFSSNTSKDLSESGRVWLNKTLSCLQTSILEGCNEKKLCSSCQTIRKLAFDTHPYCYVSSGLCSLSLNDQIQVGKTVDAGDFFTTESIAQVASVAASCGNHYVKQGLSNATYAMNEYRKKDPIFNRYVQAQTLPSDSQVAYARRALGWSTSVHYVPSNYTDPNVSLGGISKRLEKVELVDSAIKDGGKIVTVY